MTLSQKTRSTTLKTGVPHRRGTKPTRRALHRRAGAVAKPAVQNDSIVINGAQLAELRDWTILAGASLAGWMVAATAIGVV